MPKIFKDSDRKPFQKKYKVFNTATDFKMPQEHLFALWEDPSRPMLNALLGFITQDMSSATEEEVIENHQLWCEYVSEVVLDCDIEGVSFETPEDVDAAFNNPSIDSNFLFLVIYHYVNHLFETVEALKKIIKRGSEIQNSGEKEKSALPQP